MEKDHLERLHLNDKVYFVFTDTNAFNSFRLVGEKILSLTYSYKIEITDSQYVWQLMI